MRTVIKLIFVSGLFYLSACTGLRSATAEETTIFTHYGPGYGSNYNALSDQETINLYHNIHYQNKGFYPAGYYGNGYYYKRGYRR